jgi:hypothetical protein
LKKDYEQHDYSSLLLAPTFELQEDDKPSSSSSFTSTKKRLKRMTTNSTISRRHLSLGKKLE